MENDWAKCDSFRKSIFFAKHAGNRWREKCKVNYQEMKNAGAKET